MTKTVSKRIATIPSQNREKDFFLYAKTTLEPAVDLSGPGQSKLVKQSSSLIHADPATVATELLSELPALLNPNVKSLSTQCALTSTSSVLFLVDKIKAGRGPTGLAIMKAYSLHLHLEVVASGEPDFRPEQFSFRTLTAVEAANLTSPMHSAAVADTLSQVVGEPPTEVVDLSGSVTLEVAPHNCTRVGLEVTILSKTAATPPPPASAPATTKSTKTKIATSKRGLTLKMMSAAKIAAKSSTNQEDRILDHFIAVVANLHVIFARYDEVDEARAIHFETVTVRTSPPPQRHETDLFNKCVLIDDQRTNAAAWRRISNTVEEPTACFQKSSTDSSGVGKAISVVDAPSTRVLSWIWLNMSYERIFEHIEKNGYLLRKEIVVPDSHSKIMMSVQKFPGNISNRLYSIMWTWRKEDDGSFTIGFMDTDKCDDDGFGVATAKASDVIATDDVALAAVRGSTWGVWKIKPRARSVCQVTLVQQGFVGGSIPLVIVNSRLKKSIAVVDRLRDKYERRGEEVDEELREEFPRPPNLEDLSDDQKSVFARCSSLSADDALLVPVKSPEPLITMSMMHAPPANGEASVVFGIAEAVVDASAVLSLAWLFAYCSRERLRLSAEERDGPRFISSVISDHEYTLASLKYFPFPLTTREFLNRNLCAVVDRNNGTLVMVSEPIITDAKTDYGAPVRKVRGITRIYCRITPLSSTQCRIVMSQHFDACGVIPRWAMISMVPKVLGIVGRLRRAFQRDEEFDLAEREALARIIREEPQVHTSEDDAMISRVQSKLYQLKDSDFDVIESPDPLVKIRMGANKGDANIVGEGSVIVDASLEECEAWDFLMGSRARTRDFYKSKRGVERQTVPINDHSLIQHVVYDLGLGLSHREGFTKMIWKKLDSDHIVSVYEPCEPTVSCQHLERGCIRATYTMILNYERLAPFGGAHQTRVTLRVHTNLGGLIPPKFVNRQGVGFVLHLSRMRLSFDKSSDIDGFNRARLVRKFKNHSDAYSKEENESINELLVNFELFNDESSKDVKLVSPLAQGKIAFKKGDNKAWGWGSTIVRGSPEDILSFSWDTLGRGKSRADDREKSVDERLNGHNQLLYHWKTTPKFIADRDFLGRMIWKKIDYGYILVGQPVVSAARPRRNDGVIRGSFPSAMKLTRLNATETKIELVIHPSFGGVQPGFWTNMYTIKNLNRVTEIQAFFQALRVLEVWSEDDGCAVGEAMMLKTKAEKHREKGENEVDARMRHMFLQYKGLRDIEAKYDFFRGMLSRVVQNKLRPPKSVKKKLCDVSKNQGVRIGAGLAMSLASNLTAEAAVDEWIGKYPALQELDRAEVWFRPMMDVVALRLLGDVSWGLKFRVFTGAGLSTLDMISDINVILLYLSSPGQEVYGFHLACMVIACVVMQLILVYSQNRANKMSMLRESLVVLTGLKPGKL
jgi:hypothetical protein